MNAGEVHSIMGPNGSGKSTLAQVLARRDTYEVTGGEVTLRGQRSAGDEAGRGGAARASSWRFSIRWRFRASATPTFLRSALNAMRKYRGQDEMDAMDFLPLVREKLKLLDMDEALLNRSVNEGFSGGEKKRNEILQMAVLEPKLAILDETDSGLDIDALRIVAYGVNAMRSPERAMLVVTHYQRLLNYIVPDFVHVLVDGRIVRSGGANWRWSWRRRATAGQRRTARRRSRHEGSDGGRAHGIHDGRHEREAGGGVGAALPLPAGPEWLNASAGERVGRGSANWGSPRRTTRTGASPAWRRLRAHPV